uniref:Uncharacterized protein n=1 Tax=Avena sativa TaxID=4498 RepID=A0ACD5WYP0_AVESA
MIGHRLMLNLYPRDAPVAPDDDDDEPHLCYAIMVSFMSLLLFCVLLAVVSPARACAITSLIVLLFCLVACLAPTRASIAIAAARADGGGVGTRQPVPPVRLMVRRCTCGLTDAVISALPTFAYGNPAAIDTGAGAGDDGPRGSCAQLLCAVCLEDVHEGEMVRQLPPCRHLFHVDCIDLWLRTHRTCPLCRCELSPPKKVTAKAAAAAAESSADHPLPPV